MFGFLGLVEYYRFSFFGDYSLFSFNGLGEVTSEVALISLARAARAARGEERDEIGGDSICDFGLLEFFTNRLLNNGVGNEWFLIRRQHGLAHHHRNYQNNLLHAADHTHAKAGVNSVTTCQAFIIG